MYLKGLNDLDYEDAEIGYNMGVPDIYFPATQIPSAGAPVDWTGLVNNALQTGITVWTQKTQSEAQLEIAKLNAQRNLYPGTNYPYTAMPPRYSRPGFSPFPATAGGVGGMDLTTWLIMAALAGGAYFLLKD